MQIDKDKIKSAIFFIPLILLVAIGINSLFIKEDIKEDIKIIEKKENKIIQKNEPTEIIKEKIVTKTITKYIEKKDIEEIQKEDEEKPTNIFVDENYNVKTKDETSTLVERDDKSKTYKVSVISDKTITSTPTGAAYIVLNGTIHNQGEENTFSLSFNEYYKEYLSSVYIQVTNKQLDIKAKCDGTFLSGASSDYSYDIGIDIYGDSLSCYIVSEKERPNIEEILSKNKIGSLENIKDSIKLDINKEKPTNTKLN